MALASSSSETETNSPIVLGGPVQTERGTLITGQNLAAYSVLGRIAASGKLTLADQSAATGEEVPVGILVHAVDATAEDLSCQMYTGGKFNADLLVWDVDYTAAMKAAVFDNSPIILETPT